MTALINEYGPNKKPNRPFIFLVFLFAGTGFFISCFGLTNEGILKVFIFSLLIYCLYRGRREGNWTNPYYLFALTPASLLIYSANISTVYLVPLKDGTLLIALLNMLSFLIALGGNRNLSSDKPEKEIALGLNKRKKINHSIILLLISLTPIFFMAAIGVEMPFGSIIALLYFPAIAFAVSTKSKRFILFFLCIVLLRLIQGFDKTGLLFIFITVIVSVEKYLIGNRKNRRKFLLGLIAALIVFLLLFELRDYIRSGKTVLSYFSGGRSSYDNTAYYSENNVIIWSGPKSLLLPYMYFTTPWTNLQFVMETQNTRTFGLWLFKPILGYLMMDSTFTNYYVLTPYSSFNTFTFISVLFKDFGYLGSCFGSLILGLFVRKIYLGFKKTKSPFFVACYALTACAVLEMFFSNHFLGQSYPFTILLLMFVYNKFFKMLSINYQQTPYRLDQLRDAQ
jgi:hypothetical protein